MKLFRELTIDLGGASPECVAKLMRPHLGKEWAEEREYQEEIRLQAPSGGTWLSYSYSGHKRFDKVFLSMVETSPSKLKVMNIVPDRVGEISMDEYNEAVRDFADRVASAVSKDAKISCCLTNDQGSVNELYPESVAEALVRFSSLANKSTGAAHPSDRERWMAFIVEAHKASEPVDTFTLRGLLEQDLGWGEDFAWKLAGNYENSRELLAYYDGIR